MNRLHFLSFRFLHVVFLTAVLIFLPCGSFIFSIEEKNQDASFLQWVENLFKKPSAKPQKPVAQFGPISSKELKSYSESQLKSLTVKIAELDGKITKSRALYEQRKQKAWKLFLEQSQLERGNEKDADKILDTHERLSEAKALEVEALGQYQKDARELLEAHRLAEQCRGEIKKADKMLNFLNQK